MTRKSTAPPGQNPNPASTRHAPETARIDTALRRVRLVGILLLVAGLPIAGASLGYGAPTAFRGLESAQAMYDEQGVTLGYDDRGQLMHSGSVETAKEVLALLENDWKYPVNHRNLDANDPLVNTRDELMFQYAAITTDIMQRPVTVTLTEDHVPITYRGVTYSEAGDYPIVVGATYAELDRDHPIESQLRSAWSPMPLSLLASLAGGHANQAAGEMGAMVSLALGGIGLLFTAAGAGLMWVSFAASGRTTPASQGASVPIARAPRPAYVPSARQAQPLPRIGAARTSVAE